MVSLRQRCESQWPLARGHIRAAVYHARTWTRKLKTAMDSGGSEESAAAPDRFPKRGNGPRIFIRAACTTGLGITRFKA
jgi:hypothetical protein